MGCSQKLEDKNNDQRLLLSKYRGNVYNFLFVSLRDSTCQCCHKYYQLSLLLRVLVFLIFQSDDSQSQLMAPIPCPQPQSKPHLHRYACHYENLNYENLSEFKQHPSMWFKYNIFLKYINITTRSSNMLLFKSL